MMDAPKHVVRMDEAEYRRWKASKELLSTLILVRHHLGIQKMFTPLGYDVALVLDKPIREAIRKATGEEWVES